MTETTQPVSADISPEKVSEEMPVSDTAAAPQPVSVAGTQPVAPRRSVLPLIVSLCALGAAVSQPLWIGSVYPVSAPQAEDMSAPLAALKTEICTLRTQLDQLQNTPSSTPAIPLELTQQIDALKTDLSDLSSRLSNQPSFNPAPLEQRLSVLEQQSTAYAPQTELVDLRKKLDEVLQRHSQSEKGDTAQKVFASAVLQLTAAWQSGQSFDAPWQALLAAVETAAPDLVVTLNDTAPTLLPWRLDGIPQLSRLQAEYASAAVQALAKEHPEGQSWWQQSLDRLKGLVVIRRTSAVIPETEISAEATLARAETKLKAGDLAGAIDLVASLEGAPADAMSTWLSGARARLRADVLAAMLSRKVAMQLAGTAPAADPAVGSALPEGSAP